MVVQGCCGGLGVRKMEYGVSYSSFFFFFKNISLFLKRFYLFIFREKGRKGERGREKLRCKRHINRLPLTCPPLGTWPTTLEFALTGNRTRHLPVRRLVLSPLSHTSHSRVWSFFLGDEYFLNLTVVIVAWCCEYTENHWIIHFTWVNCSSIRLFFKCNFPANWGGWKTKVLVKNTSQIMEFLNSLYSVQYSSFK